MEKLIEILQYFVLGSFHVFGILTQKAKGARISAENKQLCLNVFDSFGILTQVLKSCMDFKPKKMNNCMLVFEFLRFRNMKFSS